MLIDDRKPLGSDAQLESDLLERALETGVIVDREPMIAEHHVETMLGGLISADEHVETSELDLLLISPTSAPDRAKASRRSPYAPRRSDGRGHPK